MVAELHLCAAAAPVEWLLLCHDAIAARISHTTPHLFGQPRASLAPSSGRVTWAARRQPRYPCREEVRRPYLQVVQITGYIYSIHIIKASSATHRPRGEGSNSVIAEDHVAEDHVTDLAAARRDRATTQWDRAATAPPVRLAGKVQSGSELQSSAPIATSALDSC
eukprot:358413-Chlamydomonas_euryale.AAC.24